MKHKHTILLIISVMFSGCLGTIDVEKNKHGEDVYKLQTSNWDDFRLSFQYSKLKKDTTVAIRLNNRYEVYRGRAKGRNIGSLNSFTLVTNSKTINPVKCSPSRKHASDMFLDTSIVCYYQLDDFSALQDASKLKYVIQYSTNNNHGTGSMEYCQNMARYGGDYRSCMANFSSQMRILSIYEDEYLEAIKKYATCSINNTCD